MCGIVAFNGSKNAQERIINGLEKLEYRGYDSAGIAVIEDKKLRIAKAAGRLEALEEKLEAEPLGGTTGIGHTRWATHGVPSEENAHPHISTYQRVAVVHNGIIENYQSLKNSLLEAGYTFYSDTDTEVVANLIESKLDGNLEEAVAEAVKALRGTFSLAVLSPEDPDKLVVTRRESPLILGIAEDGVFAASDVPALLDYTRDVIYLENDELVVIQDGRYEIFKDGQPVTKEITTVEWSPESAGKEGFEHYMMKEIHEQPKALEDCLRRKVTDGFIDLGEQSFTKEEIESFDHIYMSACGTAFHACQVGKRALEDALQQEITAQIASEFRYDMPFLNEKSLLIVVSQSGETGDTLAVLREAKLRGAKVLSVTNVVGSSVDRESDKVIYCDAGPEISVASTKAYSTQLLSLYLLALDFGHKLGTYDRDAVKLAIEELSEVPAQIETFLQDTDALDDIAKRLAKHDAVFYLGRGIDYLSAKEGALKLKEISYIHAQSMPAGELKHGSIALIEENLPVVTLITQSELVEKSISNIKEVKARGAYTIVITDEVAGMIDEVADATVRIPSISDLYAPILAVLPQQILAYKVSVLLGNDVDKPRNLAKSVTVE
ncbi:Glucosamine--fructose-6-phosphate aminotransferase [isomerizing] [Aedoeadaptatus ivorii]|uniref:Glutamine--fructose-6-phosphate aminotransferase [isomerizing] n=1 Tax=Aedoeadaptatus ivorii TaxID=54006 RepID=A0A3S5F7V1_9FIRM|nr:glutamine--fructose-6-phosphate transaminase (isomerizing) [Peptoniphilus ivorii]VEJ35463.1 Glucosamine--fructose-6-phosphate aminotransferase [isomerizing] [Peptoniphilus ivorii]